MDLRDYVRLLRRRWRLIAFCTLLGLLAAAAATLTQQPMYTATTSLFVAAQSTDGPSDVGSAYTGGLFVQQRVKSYADIIDTPRVASLVRDDLRLNASPESIAKQVTATAPLDTVLLNVDVVDPSPTRAQRIANSLGTQFAALVDELEQPQDGRPSPVKVSVVQPAQLPISPTSPRPTLNLALGLLVGLAIGAGAAVLRETLDTSVKSPEQAEELVGAPMLGAITFDNDAGKHPLIVQVDPRSPRAEAFRQMRTNLQFVDIEHDLKSVVITSSVPGEGKSTTACNLAISLSEAGIRVVLIEGDLRRPRVADYMGLEGAVGLTSVLLKRVALEEALQPWGEATLQVLTSGPLPPNPSELLGTAGMDDLVRRLEGQFDVVLIDAPPLLPVTDAAVLGSLTSGVLLLVACNRTSREQVKRASDTVRAVGATILGGILNMVPIKGPDAYAYGYGYGYGYGGYYDTKAKPGRFKSDESAVGRPGQPDGGTFSAWSKTRTPQEPEPAPAPVQAKVSTPPTVAIERRSTKALDKLAGTRASNGTEARETAEVRADAPPAGR